MIPSHFVFFTISAVTVASSTPAMASHTSLYPH